MLNHRLKIILVAATLFGAFTTGCNNAGNLNKDAYANAFKKSAPPADYVEWQKKQGYAPGGAPGGAPNGGGPPQPPGPPAGAKP